MVGKEKQYFGGIDSEDASKLVGGVVENGFSEEGKTSNPINTLPAPSVLPFPVARHRSHGPYWNPIPDKINQSDAEDDEDLAGYNPISVLAKPLQRKEKKGMDFSKWRKTMTNDSNSIPRVNGSGGSLVGSNKHVAAMKMLNKQVQESSNMDISTEPNNLRHIPSTERSVQIDETLKNGITEVNTKMASYQPGLLENTMGVDEERPATSVSYTDSCLTPSISVTKDGGVSVESQIDAENRYRLERMSADEISEAHAEILSKMRPELIQALRRSGQEKLKRKNAFGSDTTSDSKVNKLHSGKARIDASTVSTGGSSDKALKEL
ncbi:hypothetical protein LIER_04668 [Lithospermum erythrorhizon]|uniref:RPAP1 N-terminal domain-containing protein n=1 Tax=Lithospermum erythrorhizon TaxID=34254 RepID=A0AAV3NYI2_LITER